MDNHFEIYADASGDDGVGKPGASPFLVMALLVCRADEVSNDVSIARSLKEKFCPQRNELKGSYLIKKLRKHPDRGRRALDDALSMVKGSLLVTATIDKTNLAEAERNSLNLLHHALPLTILQQHLVRLGVVTSVRVHVDDGLNPLAKAAVNNMFRHDIMHTGLPFDVEFVDSRRFALIQLADVYARLFFDWLRAMENQTLPHCQRCRFPGEYKKDCSWAIGRNKIPGVKTLAPVYKVLLKNEYGFATASGFVIVPAPNRNRYQFIDCLLK